MTWLVWILLIIGGYLLGSIPTGYILVKLKNGIDIRHVGSGNVGSTNTVRAAGKAMGGLVFILDAAKGAIPTIIGLMTVGVELAALAGMAAFLGHLWPIWLKFSGGKGVATGFGVALVLHPIIALIGLGVWIVLVLATGYVSLASCGATVLLALIATVTHQPLAPVLVLYTLAILISWRHRSNFQKIKDGTESKAFRKKK